MRRLSGWVLAYVLALNLSGCYQLSIQSAADAPIQFNSQQILAGSSYRVLRRFYREVQIDYIFGNYEQEASIVNRLLSEEAGPHQIINLKLRRNYNALDMVVSCLTLGIYTRSWLILEGDILVWEP